MVVHLCVYVCVLCFLFFMCAVHGNIWHLPVCRSVKCEIKWFQCYLNAFDAHLSLSLDVLCHLVKVVINFARDSTNLSSWHKSTQNDCIIIEWDDLLVKFLFVRNKSENWTIYHRCVGDNFIRIKPKHICIYTHKHTHIHWISLISKITILFIHINILGISVKFSSEWSLWLVLMICFLFFKFVSALFHLIILCD